ncbi:flavonol sulfotransferase-like [Phoenix dactylifera]|uniref:Sulfotransferase n=1 Tax=Phoenix dactylifera TaxID=42345 RepID=A0A8B8ZIA0_PHODC|nr:flavonol sulfotransferase-like [Phoenix dactylifera]
MAHSQSYPLSKCLPSQTKEEMENQKRTYQSFRRLVSTLLSFDGVANHPLYCYNGWYAALPLLVSAIVAREHFKAQPADVLLATCPKTGTTWLKALLFATVNRSSHTNSHPPLATLSPHQCVPSLEFSVCVNDRIPDLDALSSPRLFGTHIPFQSLPASVIDSGCRIVYLYRDPKDCFISLWHFVNKLRAKDNIELWTLDEALEHFSNGISPFGPYWEHVLGYWNGHLERPQKVLFLKYEELMQHPKVHLKRLAEFVGSPFTEDEEKEGVVEGIIRLCSFENMSNSEVNKIGRAELEVGTVEYSLFFRRGDVGGWANHLTPEMARRLEEITESKFRGSGLSF